jgi:Zn-dependent protease
MRIGSIFGIAITVNPSWVLIFALVAYSIANPTIGPLTGVTLSTFERTVIGVLASLLFFASVLVHELAHSLLARSRGVPVRGITLFIFGGVSALESEPMNPPSEAWISAVGPLTSLLVGLGFYGLAAAFGSGSALGLMFAYLAFANVALAVFNILPAFPLDGGRVLHALVWRATGDRFRATRIAAGIGGVIAAVLIAFGIGEALVTGSAAGLWMTFIGWFLLQAGNAERRQSELSSALAGHTVGELVAPSMPRIAADETAEGALAAMRDESARVLPVYIGDRFIGFVSIDDMAKVPADELGRTYVTAIMTRAEDAQAIDPTTDANVAVRLMAASSTRALPVVSAGGELVGLLTRESVMQWLASRLGVAA